MKIIVLTGGGTAGHVMPNLALIPPLQKNNVQVHYIGGKTGMEYELVKQYNIPYHGISAGKLRRYADIKNLTDIFKVIKGLREALRLMRQIKPDAVFSKGGFVTVPVVMAARLRGVRTVIHESDITPGLANRLAIPFAHKVCCSFPETLTAVPARKGVLTGTPIRPDLLTGDKATGLKICGFEDNGKPVLLFVGGTQGAAAINACLHKALPDLTQKYRIIHICGKGNASGLTRPDYAVFEFVKDGLPHLYALADAAISRAGANTIFELLTLRKPHLLIPLTKKASRGDQIKNAASFEAQGFSKVLAEEDMTAHSLREAIDALYHEREAYIKSMIAHTASDGTQGVMEVILKGE
jgi:UDP-N-acetylglucosamine--N-acetylmuramyl-(pentapeptide) pyrophosphoryl-undecaprenol N-acetylglucosamine transferase